MTTVWHHGAWNRNFGDWVLHESIRHHLGETSRRALRFVDVDSQAATYDRERIEALNDEADLLLVGGGGLLFHRPEDGSASGWQLDVTTEDLARIRVPIAVYGIGWNRFPYDPEPFPAGFERHVRAVQERTALFSVRNTGTRAELARCGLAPGRIRVVPDAGVFAPARELDLSRALAGDAPVIGWNVAGDRPAHRYPAPAEENERRCIATVARGVRRLCEQTGARVLLIPHLLEIDERHDALIREIVGPGRVVSLRDAVPELYPPRAETAALLVGAYDRCDLVIGMRGHACLIPFGRGRRFVAFGSHCKTRFLLRDLGAPRLRLLPEEILTGRIGPDEVAALLRHAGGDPGFGVLLHRARSAQRAVFQQLNRDVIRTAQAPGAAFERGDHERPDPGHR